MVIWDLVILLGLRASPNVKISVTQAGPCQWMTGWRSCLPGDGFGDCEEKEKEAAISCKRLKIEQGENGVTNQSYWRRYSKMMKSKAWCAEEFNVIVIRLMFGGSVTFCGSIVCWLITNGEVEPSRCRTGVGNILENDSLMAAENNGVIYGLMSICHQQLSD